MRISKFLIVAAAAAVLLPQATYARAGGDWTWWPGHWKDMDFKPYLGDSKLTQRGLWDKDTWTPEAWIKDAGDEKRIIHDLYATDIISDQYIDSNNIPVLEVGQNFKRLSGLDRRRVMEFVDYVFNITGSEENGMFFVFYREKDNKEIGVYDKNGFQEN